ncbi:MAG: hypothetical protein P8Z40_13805 [Chloroflexota bacterium]
MIESLSESASLEADALYLAILAARGVKPLSRLEYPVPPDVLLILESLGLALGVVTRVARNGALCTHRVMSLNPGLVRQYLAEFDGALLSGRAPSVVRAEARYFGYPPCCAEAFIAAPYAPNGLPWADQCLLFHHACPACVETPGLLPLYRAAHAEAQALFESLICAGVLDPSLSC